MSERNFRASLSQSQGRQGWTVIFRHPLKTDAATGKPGRRVRKGLDTKEKSEAERLVAELNDILSQESLWGPAARGTALGRYDRRIVRAFYDDLTPEAWDFFGVRDGVIKLPSSKDSAYRRVLLLGTTGSGKTTLVRQLLGTDPRTERFPSTSTARTTVADTEVVIDEGPYRAVVTFMPRDQVRDYIEECLSAAVLAAHLQAPDSEVLRRILNHIDQRFRLSYVLGAGLSSLDDIDDWDAQELDFEEDGTASEMASSIDLTRTNDVLTRTVENIRVLAGRKAEQLRQEISTNGGTDPGSFDEAYEDNLDRLLRDDDEFFDLADDIIEEVERRFESLTEGELLKDTQGWPKLWKWQANDRKVFLKAISRFSSNYAPLFGTLLTPIVNGIRVAGPFRPGWLPSPRPLVLLDGEGLGHTPDSAASLPTSVTSRFEIVDAILLVDNGAQPMQAAPQAVMRGVAAVGQTHKLIFCFTHFDQVIGDNLPTFKAKEQHVLASVENTLRNLGEQLGSWAERALRQRLGEAAFFVGGIHEMLDGKTKRGSRSIEQIKSILDAVDKALQPLPATGATAVYDKTNLVLAVQNAAESFHEGWRARLGKDIKPGVAKEPWNRVKALARRLAEGWADEYDNLRPIADMHLLLQQELYKAIQDPRNWRPRPPSDDEKQAFFERFVNRVSGDIMSISSRRLKLERVPTWQEAYNQSGKGSSFVRAAIIADRIYTPAAPVAPVPDRAAFLKEVLDVVERAAPECSAELR